MPIIYTPDNEPYLGRESVYQFDQVIISCLEANADVAAFTRSHDLSDLQGAASQIIPQGINLALSIRELVRQGYLFGAAVLMRPLIERAAMITFLAEQPDKVFVWKTGWKHGERPSLAKMLSMMTNKYTQEEAQRIIDLFNHLDHGDPLGAEFNLVKLNDSALGYSVSKALDEPELCDFICFQSCCYLIVIMGRMAGCFPGIRVPELEGKIH